MIQHKASCVGAALLVFGAAIVLPAAGNQPVPGLSLSFRRFGGAGAKGTKPASDTIPATTVALFVRAGEPPTLSLGPGRFTATWDGSVLADLRGNFSFQATLRGRLTLDINGTPALDTESDGQASPWTKPIQLNKGTNAFKAVFTSPENGDAFVRLGWSEKPPFTSPIPGTALQHSPGPAEEATTLLYRGRELFLEHRCIRCHTDPVSESGIPELRMDAPALDGPGGRRHEGWVTRWIADPASLRPTARMPKLLHGVGAGADAEAITAYLVSVPTGTAAGAPVAEPVAYKTRQNEPREGEQPLALGQARPLYERLHCLGCHNAPDAASPDPQKLSQKRIAEKFPAGKLAEFLRSPEARYAWTRMPNFHLSDKEARELEAWLFAAAPKPGPDFTQAATTDPLIRERGRRLVQTSGCLNCHSLPLENRFQAPRLAELGADRWTHGCLAANPGTEDRAPRFAFSAADREALQAFGRADRALLSRHVPAEFAERQTRLLQCTACHGQLEGFPPLELLGGKLKAVWAARFIAGEIPHKIRYDAHPKGEVWLEVRMPAFRSRATALAAGLAAQAGYSAIGPAEPPVDATLAGIGRKLVGKDGGFFCVACHAVGSQRALEVFESEGVNLALSADRLIPEFYQRWLRAPTSIDPQTKMPVYFDDDKSPLTDVLGGDAEKQIRAVWEYFRLRDRMSPPKNGAP